MANPLSAVCSFAHRKSLPFLFLTVGVGVLAFFALTPSLRTSGAHVPATAFDLSPSLRPGLSPDDKMTAHVDANDLPKALRMYAELTGRSPWPPTRSPLRDLDEWTGNRLTKCGILKTAPGPSTGICYHRDGGASAIEVKEKLEALFHSAGIAVEPYGTRYFRVVPHPARERAQGS